MSDEVSISEDTTNSAEYHAQLAELSRRGYQHLKRNEINEALSDFRTILEDDPENNYALVGIGDAYRKKLRYQEATLYYERCLQKHPRNNYALFGLADCYRCLKQFHRAIDVWESYLALDDQNVTVLTRVADAYRKVKNLSRSRDIYLQVLSMESDNPYALIGLGHLYYDFKDYQHALQYWERMHTVQGQGVDIRVLTSLGNCHRKLKTFQVGIPYFEQALGRDSENFYALFGLADCYRGLNQQDQSLNFWNRILDHDPNNKVILTRAGDAYRKLGKQESARNYYRRALDIEYDAYAVLGLALLNKLEQRYEEAADSLEQLLKQDPNLHRLYPELMDCYVSSGKHKAAQELQQRLQRNPHVYEDAIKPAGSMFVS